MKQRLRVQNLNARARKNCLLQRLKANMTMTPTGKLSACYSCEERQTSLNYRNAIASPRTRKHGREDSASWPNSVRANPMRSVRSWPIAYLLQLTIFEIQTKRRFAALPGPYRIWVLNRQFWLLSHLGTTPNQTKGNRVFAVSTLEKIPTA